MIDIVTYAETTFFLLGLGTGVLICYILLEIKLRKDSPVV